MLDGFVHPNQVGPYLLSEGIFEHITYSVVGNEGCLGLAWKFGPLAFEAYTSDVEPRIAVGPLRTIFWQRIGHIDTLPGWHTFFNRHSDMGVAEIKNPEAYWEGWTKDARRRRRRFLFDEHFTIERVSFQDYLSAYSKIIKFKSLRSGVLRDMKIKEKIFRTDLAYFAALDTRNDKILAGMAILDLPSIRQSIYYKAFSDDTVRRSSAATGLIDHWYRMSIQKGIRFQNFGVFWSPGQPRSWKGFSRFKAQFGVQMIHFPKMLVKITRGDRTRFE